MLNSGNARGDLIVTSIKTNFRNNARTTPTISTQHFAALDKQPSFESKIPVHTISAIDCIQAHITSKVVCSVVRQMHFYLLILPG